MRNQNVVNIVSHTINRTYIVDILLENMCKENKELKNYLKYLLEKAQTRKDDSIVLYL